jgi:hypothetical protein
VAQTVTGQDAEIWMQGEGGEWQLVAHSIAIAPPPLGEEIYRMPLSKFIRYCQDVLTKYGDVPVQVKLLLDEPTCPIGLLSREDMVRLSNNYEEELC